ncbi:Malonyl-[acyl-carrier protein] O-methyltransferase [Planctomycetes bacterium Poly30]|uniref:Malonyl-[acyl-carrier protein] O-methyltransferase n=1 Tax=Saltatorellus ferox TaxID=2528018 RepID=A0A518EKE9_9BACT|nr:Malonyl-[acyl-carrier protein] O-methyltransferase [Planctomycetes bacterium Poly30]
MPESTATLYNDSAANWQRSEPILLSDFTARPFLLDWCGDVQGQSVLDLGCGEGYVARKLLEKGAGKIEGRDISMEMIENARASIAPPDRDKIAYEVGDATNLSGHPDAAYDLVVAVFLFNYLDRAQTHAAMVEIARVLKPGGRFIFAVPHPSLAFLRAEERPFYFSRGDHGYFSGRDALFEGKIWRRDGHGVRVRCVHKTLDDYFSALNAAGFGFMPELKELHATAEHLAFDPDFFEPLRDQPLHMALRVKR